MYYLEDEDNYAAENHYDWFDTEDVEYIEDYEWEFEEE